jgi:hypothetical protein
MNKRGWIELDTEEDIERAAEQIVKDTGGTKIDALDVLLDKYQSQRRLEEAVRVQTIIRREQDRVEYYGHGFQQDM